MPGASEQVNAVFSYAYQQADAKTSQSTTKFAQVQSYLNALPDLKNRNWAGRLSDINSALPRPLDGAPFTDDNFRVEYGAVQADAAARLSVLFADYLETWFPLSSSFEAAQTWVNAALTTGGTGINVNVETQLWNRDRARVLEDLGRVQDEAIAGWAAKRFPLPPGAATYQVLQLQRDAQIKIADVSREQAIKSFQTEIENVRLALGRAIELRQAVVDNAEKFFRIELFPEKYGQEVESAKFDIRNKFLTSAEDLYKLNVNSFEQYQHRNVMADLTDIRQLEEMNQANKMKLLEERVNAALAEAAQLATQAAAALNSLHAQASISGSDTTVVNV